MLTALGACRQVPTPQRSTPGKASATQHETKCNLVSGLCLKAGAKSKWSFGEKESHAWASEPTLGTTVVGRRSHTLIHTVGFVRVAANMPGMA